MKNNTSELVFILDRSGSISGFETDTIGGFNVMVEKQKKPDSEVYVSTHPNSAWTITYPEKLTEATRQKYIDAWNTEVSEFERFTTEIRPI